MPSINDHKIIDSILVLHCKSGNNKAFAVLVKRWHPKLCKQANWYVRDADLAKDIAQDSWSIIYKKIHRLKDNNSFGSWALMIVKRTALDWLRKNAKEHKALRRHFDNSNHHYVNNISVSTVSDTGLLRKAIMMLPVKQQVILDLFYMEELSINEISIVLEVSTGTVKSRLFTAREKLKTILKNRYHEK
ncbi:MAG: sigma-70 family RNA polymerase sigma factor [Bacteroidetes bacterium]|nr:sigma-70 family RNA polymerase sigma factor [Bacteroidota bacterium]